MTIPRSITEYLESHHVPYRHGTHEPSFTAQEIAHAQHVSGKILAKPVIVVADGRLVMAVVPANDYVDFAELQRLLGADRIRMASEAEFAEVFPGCEPGAMPPLGTLYHVPVWVDVSLKGHAQVVFNAGTHIDTIRMSFDDFEKLVEPRVARFAARPH